MRFSWRLLMVAVTVALASGCAGPAKTAGWRADSRAGTDLSPYRTMPVVIQCSDCRYDGR
jgi:hypothetical protein